MNPILKDQMDFVQDWPFKGAEAEEVHCEDVSNQSNRSPSGNTRINTIFAISLLLIDAVFT
jgi:hypothetical protein